MISRKGLAIGPGPKMVASVLVGIALLVAVFPMVGNAVNSIGSRGDASDFDKLVQKTREKCSTAVSDADTNEPYEPEVSFSRLNSLEIIKSSSGLNNKFVADFVDSSSTRVVPDCDMELADESEGDSVMQSGSWVVEIKCEENCGTSSKTPEISLTARKR